MLQSNFSVQLDGMEAEMIAQALIEKGAKCTSMHIASHYAALAGRIRNAKKQYHESVAKQMEAKYMNSTTIPYSKDRFDQWRLSQVGGSITFDKKGRMMFFFPSWQQYQQYISLNERRDEFGNGAASTTTQLAR